MWKGKGLVSLALHVSGVHRFGGQWSPKPLKLKVFSGLICFSKLESASSVACHYEFCCSTSEFFLQLLLGTLCLLTTEG